MCIWPRALIWPIPFIGHAGDCVKLITVKMEYVAGNVSGNGLNCSDLSSRVNTGGCQSTRHTVNSSQVNSSPGRLVTQSIRHKEAVNSSQANKQANIKAVLPQQYKTADLEKPFPRFPLGYLYDYLWQLHWYPCDIVGPIKKDRPIAWLKRKPSPLRFTSWIVKQQQQHRDSCATTSDRRGSTPLQHVAAFVAACGLTTTSKAGTGVWIRKQAEGSWTCRLSAAATR